MRSLSRVLRNVVVADEPSLAAVTPKPRRISSFQGETFTQAYERGKRDGMAAGAKATDEAIDRLGATIESAVQGALAELRALQSDRISRLIGEALAIAEFVVGHSASVTTETLVMRIESVLSALDDEPLEIHVAPTEVDSVTEALGTGDTVRVVADSTLAPGEARVSGPWANADLTKEAAFAAVREALE